MKRHITIGAAIGLATVLSGAASVAADPPVQKHAPVLWTSDRSEVPGASTKIVANGDQAHVTMHTNGLTGGNAYTLWSISFSHPENCTDGDPNGSRACGFGDAGNPATGFFVQQVAGHPVGASGNTNFGGTVTVANAGTAEYHIVVADHGQLEPAQMPEQIKSAGPDIQISVL